MGVTFVVTNVELVVVHIFRFFNHPWKETAAGEGITLFDREIKPHLAVFQNIVSNILIVGNFVCWLSAKQSYGLGIQNRILSLGKDAFSVSNVKRV